MGRACSHLFCYSLSECNGKFTDEDLNDQGNAFAAMFGAAGSSLVLDSSERFV